MHACKKYKNGKENVNAEKKSVGSSRMEETKCCVCFESPKTDNAVICYQCKEGVMCETCWKVYIGSKCEDVDTTLASPVIHCPICHAVLATIQCNKDLDAELFMVSMYKRRLRITLCILHSLVWVVSSVFALLVWYTCQYIPHKRYYP